MDLRDFEGKRATVMGLGLLGGGVGVARFLARQGARVTVTDLKDEAALADSLARLEGLPIAFHLGGHCTRDFTEADLVVVNPAVPDRSPFLAAARQAGVPLETEINLFFKLCPASVLGVTGSNGKSTTASLLAGLLEAGPRRVWLGGNIGRSLLEDLSDIEPDDLVVLELSSFQLQRLAATGLSPHLAVVLNCTPNHLDRHGTFAGYVRAKQPILANQGPGDRAVLNADCPTVAAWGHVGQGRKLFVSTRRRLPAGAWMEGDRARWCVGGSPRTLFRRQDVPLPGEHNLTNALAAASAAAWCGVVPEAIAPRLRQFRTLEHRLEKVRSLDGVDYYDDSKATTPEAATAALRAFDRPVVLIAGGSPKGLSFDALATAAVQRARAAVLIGQTAERLRHAIAAHGELRVRMASDLADAVRQARALAQPGDVVLLSPGCASYDMFENFEQRGEEFKRLVMELEPCCA
ncbi:MAG: UDP-N-acetylmuramoyl-L-alanine--D-glutamate ligase [Candidatus Brocadiia bacterium]